MALVENGKKAWLFTSCILLFILLVGGETALPERKSSMQEKCTYVVTVETTCTNEAATSSPVSLRFGDSNTTEIMVRRLNTKHRKRVDPLQPDHPSPLEDNDTDPTPLNKPFQPCTVDEFRVTGLCVDSPVCYLYLKLAGADDWRPGFARVDVIEREGLSSEQFYFRRFLPRREWHGSDLCAGELTPFGIKSKRKTGMKKLII